MVYSDRKVLVADTMEELHAFAGKIKLHKGFFRNKQPVPYYQLVGHNIFRKAIFNGAIMIKTNDIIDIFKLKDPNEDLFQEFNK